MKPQLLRKGLPLPVSPELFSSLDWKWVNAPLARSFS
jgi:hypothetical protein